MAPATGATSLQKMQHRRCSLGALVLAVTFAVLGTRHMCRAPAAGFVGGAVAPAVAGGRGASDFVGGGLPVQGDRAAQSKLPRYGGGAIKVMRERISSVQKTAKVTDAMRLIAAAKVRRAQTGLEKSRPFSEELQGMIKGLVKKLKGSGLEQELPMLRVPEKVSNVGILMVTANRGLCGAYNSFIIKKTKKRVADLNELGVVPKLIVVGKKGVGSLNTKLKDSNLNFTGSFFDMPDTITAKTANDISETLRSYFLSGEVDKIEIIYSRFINLLTNEPAIKTLLPLSPLGIEDPNDEAFKLTSEDGKLKVEKEKVKKAKVKEIESDVIFDQPPATIINNMLPLYLNSLLISLLYDAQASELSSRMNAMKAATDNAEALAADLTLKMNKERQAGITAEISEISSGAAAVDEKGDRSYGPGLGVFDNEGTVEEDFMKEIEDGSIPEKPLAPEDQVDIEQRPEYDRYASSTLDDIYQKPL
jgi:F-type H+-transporting ATPase subunit gamma